MTKNDAPITPDQAHVTRQTIHEAPQLRDEDDADLEATEMHAAEARSSQRRTSPPSHRADAGSSQQYDRHGSLAKTVHRVEYSKLGRFWRRQVHVAVPHEKCRDHLALERTFLAFLRTSTALAMAGVLVAQAFRLRSNLDKSGFGLHQASKGIASMLIGAAIIVQLTGAWRFWSQQNAMVRGKIRAAGWELHLTGYIAAAVCIVLLIVICAVPDT